MTQTILSANNINKWFHDAQTFHALKDVNLDIKKGEFVSIMGKSGCGKSTLLYILSTMDTDYKGELYIDQELITDRSADYLARIRNQKIGFVFQFHYLLAEFSVLQNVMLPALKLGNLTKKEIEHNAYEKLKMLEIEDQALKSASKLSGGQKQRVAIARALINEPLIIMGDEPTGNLDSRNTNIVFDLLREISGQNGQSLIVVTHDQDFAQRTDRIIEMHDGKVVN